jgi:two-component system, sensor histidine kinase and response regulator
MTSENRGNVLLVDDQPANLEVLSKVLSDQGYRVRAVTSGARALESAKLLPPECILLDVAMPEMDGFATCRALRAVPELEAVPVIFITAFDDTEHKVQAFRAGGRDYVAKPFQAEEVLARVETQVHVGRMERELREHNVRLTQANAQLEQLNAMRARLSAMLVHDLKSPLTVIGTALSGEVEHDPELLMHARGSYDKILRLVQELLELYRSQHLSSEIEKKPIDLYDLAEAALSAARHPARQRGVELVMQQLSSMPPIMGDPEKLDRVLANLLENAIKYTPTGGSVSLRLGTERGTGVEEGVTFAMLSVVDTGPGIPPEDLPYIFDPYRQRDTQKSERGSVGLGLSIVRRLVANHSGQVHVHSRVGVGSEFRVLLPL